MCTDLWGGKGMQLLYALKKISLTNSKFQKMYIDMDKHTDNMTYGPVPAVCSLYCSPVN